MKQFYVLFLFCLCSANPLWAQFNTGPQEPIVFSEQTIVLANPQFKSVLITGVGDINGDGLDDIIRLNQGRTLEYQLQLANGKFITQEIGIIADKPQYSMALADIDGNNQPDLLIAGNGDGIKIFRNNQTTPELLENSSFFAQGINLVDINGDGYLDLFANNDTATIRTWQNDGQGNFIFNDQLMPLAINPVDSLNGGNYAAVWTDIDNDRDLDCFVAKCYRRPFPNDPRLVNQLFLNNGSSGYTEDAAARGLASAEQSWTADFQDVDNDGDMDCFLLNHYTTSELLINDGNGFFTNETQARGIRISRNHFQSLMRDFDNDGWIDLLVAGNNGYEVYQNKGDGTFAFQRRTFEDYLLGTFAVGDLNRDGFLDVYSASPIPVFTDKLWLNQQNDKNHFLGIALEGKAPRQHAVGARVYLYGDWGVQIREVRVGESYGINNSKDLHFGIGENLVIDSMRVDWPDGETERFYGVLGDQYIKIIQGDCMYPDDQIKVGGDFKICQDEMLELTAPAGLVYTWSNGEVDRKITVAEPGTYAVTVIGEQGCARVSRPVQIEVEDLSPPTLMQEGSPVFCEGESFVLSAPNDLEDFAWSDGTTYSDLVITESGSYFLEVANRCGTIMTEPITTTKIDLPEEPIIPHDTLSAPGNVLLKLEGENLNWYTKAGELLATGDRVIVPVPQTDTFFVARFENESGLLCESERVPVYVIVDPSISNPEPEATEVSIFPNPSPGEFQITIPRLWANVQASFYAVDGRKVHQVELVTGPNKVILPVEMSGVYMVALKNNLVREVRRVVVR